MARIANPGRAKKVADVMPRRFEGVLERPEGVGTWTFLAVPADVDKRLPSAEVKGTLDGVPYRSTLLPSGDGKRFLVVKKQMRDAIRKTADDKVRVSMEIDLAPRLVEIPKDLDEALSGNEEAREFFLSLSPSRKKQYTGWIEGSKKSNTRKARIEKAVGLLSERKKLK